VGGGKINSSPSLVSQKSRDLDFSISSRSFVLNCMQQFFYLDFQEKLFFVLPPNLSRKKIADLFADLDSVIIKKNCVGSASIIRRKSATREICYFQQLNNPLNQPLTFDPFHKDQGLKKKARNADFPHWIKKTSLKVGFWGLFVVKEENRKITMAPTPYSRLQGKYT